MENTAYQSINAIIPHKVQDFLDLLALSGSPESFTVVFKSLRPCLIKSPCNKNVPGD